MIGNVNMKNPFNFLLSRNLHCQRRRLNSLCTLSRTESQSVDEAELVTVVVHEVI